MNEAQVIELILKEFPSWNDQIELDEYDVRGLLSILGKRGLLNLSASQEPEHE